MAKSLEEVMKKMQLEHEQRQQARQAEEHKAAMIAEQQRRQWAERNRMFEKSTTTSASSAAAGAGAGGRLKKRTDFLVFELSTNKLGFLMEDGTVTHTSKQPFQGMTVLTSCADDPGFLYFVTQDPEGATFGKLNKSSFQRTDIDTTNLRAISSDLPNSLAYAGGGTFYYIDSFISLDDDSVCSTFTITTNGLATAVGEINHGSYFTQALFKYDGQWYLDVTDGYLAGLFSIDFEESTTELLNPFYMDVDSLPENIGPSTKVWYVFDTVNKGDKLYASVIFTDKDHGAYIYACVGEMILDDPSNPYIKYAYALPDPFGFNNNVFTSIDAI